MYIGNTPFQGLVGGGNILDASIEGVDLSTSAIAARLGYTPVDPGAAVFSANPTISSGTANGVAYLNGSKVVNTSANLTFSGQSLSVTNNGALVSGSVALSIFGGNNMAFSAAANGEGYTANTQSAKYPYYQAGTVASFNANANGVDSGLLIDLNAYNSGNGATNVYFGAVAGATGNGPANFVIGRRIGATSWAESLRVDTSGNLGINTNNPLYLLDVNGIARARNRFIVGPAVDSADRMFYVSGTSPTSGTNQFAAVINPTLPNTVTGSAYGFYTNLNVASGANITNAYGLYVDSLSAPSGTITNKYALYVADTNNSYFAGNLGINITSPGAKLDVQSGTTPAVVIRNSYSYAQANYHIRIIGDGSSSGYISQLPAQGGLSLADGMRYYGAGPWVPDAGITAASAINQLSGAITFTTNQFTANTNFTPTERMRIASTGFIGIGTTSPQSKLHVVGDVNQSISLVAGADATGAIAYTNSELRQCAFNVTSGSNFRISNITTSATSWRAIFRGTWSNNYEGGGLVSPAPYIEVNAANPSIVVGSRTVTVSRDASGYLIVNNSDSYRVAFTGSIEIFDNTQSTQPTNSIVALGGALFSKTSSSVSVAGHTLGAGGYTYHTYDGGNVMWLNRLSNNGDIQIWQQGNSDKLSAGTYNGSPYIGGGNGATSAGFMFNGASIEPTYNGGANRNDAGVDFGSQNYRWKRGYFTNFCIGTTTAPPGNGLIVGGPINAVGGIVSDTVIHGTIASNFTGQRWLLLDTITSGSGLLLYGDFVSASYTTELITKVYIRKDYNTNAVSATLTGVGKAGTGQTCYVQTVTYGGVNYVALSTNGGDPGWNASWTGFRMNAVWNFVTSGVTVVTTHATY